MRMPLRLSHGAFVDVALAALFTLAAQLDVWVRGTVEGPRLENALLLVLVAPPLLLRRRFPTAAFVVIMVGVALQALLVAGRPPSGLLYAGPILLAAYSVGAHSRWTWRTVAALVVFVVAFDGVYNAAEGGVNGSLSEVGQELFWLLVPGGAWGLGWYLRGRRIRLAAAAEALAAEREGERQRLAVLEAERVRMARELHDILAHSVSLMGVQAGAAEEVLAGDPERARPVLRAIQQISRESVVELRRLLGMLRARDGEDGRAPQPDLAQLEALTARMRAAGLPVALTIEGAARTLPPGVELTAYRVVQEALTNALKHARPTRVQVLLRYRSDRLELVVSNDGTAAAARASGVGHGLLGMEERVSLYGGRLDVGRDDDDGFRVEAEIPFEAVPA